MVATIEIPEGFIPFRYLLWASAAIAAMIAAIIAGNFWLLDFIHVFSRTYLKIAGCCRSDINAE
jgi:hypothetical protein